MNFGAQHTSALLFSKGNCSNTGRKQACPKRYGVRGGVPRPSLRRSPPLPPATGVVGCSGLEHDGSLPPWSHCLKKKDLPKLVAKGKRACVSWGSVSCSGLQGTLCLLGGLSTFLLWLCSILFLTVSAHLSQFGLLTWQINMFPCLRRWWFPFLPVQEEICLLHAGSAGVMAKQWGLAKQQWGAQLAVGSRILLCFAWFCLHENFSEELLSFFHLFRSF